VGVTVHPDVRPAEIQASEGPQPETRAGLPNWGTLPDWAHHMRKRYRALTAVLLTLRLYQRQLDAN
jgi:hypothetical protein